MDFGRLKSLEGVRFELPPDDAGTPRVLSGVPGSPRIHVGGPVWRHDGFVGKIYPKGTKAKDYLLHYARQFNTIELNTTFYGVQRDSLRRWADLTPPEFRFCPKLPGAISHDARLYAVEREVDAFLDSVSVFGERLGTVWTVLPPSFGPESFRNLEAFVRHVTDRQRVAVELRSPAWYADARAHESVFSLFEECGAVAVIADTAGRRDVVHMRLTAPAVFLRFSGNRLHPTDFSRLDAWAERVGAWCRSGLEEAYLFLHQPEEHETVELAEHFVPRLAAAAGVELAAPVRVTNREQGTLF